MNFVASSRSLWRWLIERFSISCCCRSTFENNTS